MNLYRATEIANQWLFNLRDGCERIEIAGSVRRRKAEVHDVELVAVPKMERLKDLFGNPDGERNLLEQAVENIGPVMKKNGPRYKCIVEPYDGAQIDLFVVLPPAQWGVIFAIRTGPALFSKRLVTSKRYSGYLPSQFVIKDGAVWEGSRMYETPTEESFFELIGLPWKRPEERF
jgi:DNA polymerase/3'-5' exonuclease PolX